MGDGVIFRLHGGLAPRERGFALWYGALAALNFALSDRLTALRKAGRAKNQHARGDECAGERARHNTSCSGRRVACMH